MDFKIIEKNLDYESMNFQFCKRGNPEIEKYIRDEIVSQLIVDTTLAHNRWQAVPGRKNILRSTGGFSLLTSNNKFILQASGEAHLSLDEFDIKDIFIRAQQSVQKNRKFDIEQMMDVDLNNSIGRLDSQITIAIPKKNLDDFFSFAGFTKSGRDRTFRHTINGENVFAGKSWIKNREIDPYTLSPDELKKCPQTDVKKRDFIRIYDKLIEIIDTTVPFSDKRNLLIDKYKDFIHPDVRIFRIEIQEMDRGLTREMSKFLDTDKATFTDLADSRLRVFAKRNPFRMWDDLLGGSAKESAQR